MLKKEKKHSILKVESESQSGCGWEPLNAWLHFLIETIKQFTVQVTLAKWGLGSVEVQSPVSLKVKYSSKAFDPAEHRRGEALALTPGELLAHQAKHTPNGCMPEA